MSKSTRNSGKSWTASQVSQLKQLAKQNTPSRTESSIRSKASANNILLKPTNQSPYNKRKK